MANKQHFDILKQGVETWNQWRQQQSQIQPDLTGADLRGANLRGANLRGAILGIADLSHADLTGANLISAYLSGFDLIGASLEYADLSNTNLTCANLKGSNLRGANLTYADLNEASLDYADLREANLTYADLSSSYLSGVDLGGADLGSATVMSTHFGGIDLRTVKGLKTINHRGPSYVSTSTIERSQGNIPEVFLRGVGLNDTFIAYVRSLVARPIEYHTCFLSYSSKDQVFAERLYADLQSNNVRCWFAPEDLKIGDKFRHRIDESIRLYDKLLLVLTEHSLASNWVAYEVEKALNKEPEGVPNVLFPIRLDEAILTCEKDWAKDIRRSRHIGDFEHWKDHDAYQRAFQRLLRDLKAQSKQGA